MVLIKKDMSYLSEIDLKAVENGIATLAVHSINLSRYYTDDQKAQNKAFSDTCTREQWSKHCNEVANVFADKMESIVSEIAKQCTIHQYKDSSTSYNSTEWNLHYWTNESRDSVQLSSNKYRTLDEQIKDIENVIAIMKQLEIENVSARIQYKVIYNDTKVSEIAKNVCEKFVDKMINYGGNMGKIKVLNVENGNVNYAFFKKGARKNCYKLNDKALLTLHFENLAV